MANATIKITALPNVGNNLATTSVLPIVTINNDLTEKVSISSVGNLILDEAGNTLNPAFLSTLSYAVTNAAQPNITSVGPLTSLSVTGNVNGNLKLAGIANLKIPGGTNGYVLQTDGTGNLSWTAQTGGGGNGVPGGANTQIQFNDAGVFGGQAGFTFDNTSNTLSVSNITTDSIHNLSGFVLENADATHGTTATISIPANGNTDPILLNNTYGNITLQTGVNASPTATWTFLNNGNLTLPSDLSAINYANGSQYGAAVGNSGQVQINWLGSFSNQGGTPGDTYSTLNFDSNGMPTLDGTTAYQQRVDYSPYMQILAPRVESTDFGIIAGPAIQITGYADESFYNTPRSAYLTAQDQANATQQWDFGILGNGSNNYSISDRTNGNTWTFGTDGNLTLPTDGGTGAATVSINFAGVGYTTATDVPTNALTGTGSGMTVDIVASTSGSNPITSVTVNQAGTGYAPGDSIQVAQPSSTGNGTLTVDSITPVTIPSINYANGDPYGGGAAGNAGDIQINVAGNIGADSTLRYEDNGGEMTLYADYLNAPGIFTSDIYAGNGTPSNITLTTSIGNATWTLDTTGNLTLPKGGSIYSEGFTPSGNPGNTITLNPHGSGSITNQKLLVYPTAGDGDHIHLTSGNLYQTELFLGSDSLFVKLANTGNIIINSDDDAGNTAQWKFGIDGNLTASGNLIIAGNTNVFGTDAALIQPTDDKPLLSLSSGANGAVSSLWVEDIGNVGTSNIAAVYANPTVGSKIVRIAVGQNGGNTGPNLWDFNTNGTLTLPNGAVIKDTAGNSVAFGWGAGSNTQGNSAVAVGNSAGQTSQGTQSVAVGQRAGFSNQGPSAVAIGAYAGNSAQGERTVAVGLGAGITSQGNSAIAIGAFAGNSSQGTYSIAIGSNAGDISQANNSIILNASGGPLNQTTANTFTVAPVRNDVANTGQVVFYNTSSKEITYGNTISVAGNVTGNYFIGNGSQLTSVATSTTGNWTLAPGVNTVNLSVPLNGTYSIWVRGNIPNGIVTYTATAVVTNTNVPVVGSSYGWYYAAGNALVLTSIPTQFVGTVNNISNAVVSTTTANVFTFGITNNSGANAVVNWSYTKL